MRASKRRSPVSNNQGASHQGIGWMTDNKKPRTRVRGFLHEAPEWRRTLNLP